MSGSSPSPTSTTATSDFLREVQIQSGPPLPPIDNNTNSNINSNNGAASTSLVSSYIAPSASSFLRRRPPFHPASTSASGLFVSSPTNTNNSIPGIGSMGGYGSSFCESTTGTGGTGTGTASSRDKPVISRCFAWSQDSQDERRITKRARMLPTGSGTSPSTKSNGCNGTTATSDYAANNNNDGGGGPPSTRRGESSSSSSATGMTDRTSSDVIDIVRTANGILDDQLLHHDDEHEYEQQQRHKFDGSDYSRSTTTTDHQPHHYHTNRNSEIHWEERLVENSIELMRSRGVSVGGPSITLPQTLFASSNFLIGIKNNDDNDTAMNGGDDDDDDNGCYNDDNDNDQNNRHHIGHNRSCSSPPPITAAAASASHYSFDSL